MLFPRGISSSPVNGDIAVFDSMNIRMKHFTSGGAFLNVWGQSRTVDTSAPGLFGSFAQSYPEGWSGKLETHECVEEFYLLSGELHAGNCGVMQPGAYFWRPPHIEHGPYGTIGGYFAFFRCIHGPMYNIWSDHEVDFDYYPPYKPAVPPELEKYVREPPAGTSNY